MWRIMAKSDSAAGSPSSVQSALKILCRQCSELACANIISSTSVGLRPRRVKFSTRYSSSSSDKARPSSRLARTRASLPSSSTSIIDSGIGSPVANTRPRSRGVSSTVSVMRSCRHRCSAGLSNRVPDSKTYRIPRSTRSISSSPQFCNISVAFDDHGERVPSLGTTYKAFAGSASDSPGLSRIAHNRVRLDADSSSQERR